MYGSTSSSSSLNQDQDKLERDALLAPPPMLRRASSTRSVRKRRLNMLPSRPVLEELFLSPVRTHSPQGSNRVVSSITSRRRVLSYSFVHTLLNPRSRQWQAVAYKSFISIVILTDLCIFILSTDDTFYTNNIHPVYLLEGIVSTIFLVEFIARLVIISESKHYGKLGPIRGRLSYLATPGAIIDFLATFPFFLEICFGWDLPTLTYLRFFRLFRILKTEGYVRAIDAVYRVIYYNRQILYVALLVCWFLVLLTAVLLYYLRPPPDSNPDTADSFASIPATLYLSTLMLTGQGGPDGDLPWYTKCVILLTSVFSVAMFAIPASMLTWGFEAEAARCAKMSWKRANKSVDSGDSSCTSSDEDNSGGNSTDEEYFKIIAGEEDDVEDDSKTAWMKAQMSSFKKADADNSGTISLSEYIQMQAARENDEARQNSCDDTVRQQLEALEKKVNANNKKLDMILEILGKHKDII